MPSRTSAGPPPRVPCVSRHIKRDQFRASIAPGVHARGLGSKANVLPRQGSPSRRTRRRRGLRVGIRSHLRTPAPSHPSMRIAATAARCLPKLVAADAHVLPSAHGLRISIRCVTADPDSGRRPYQDIAWALCAANTAREVGPLARDPSSDPRRSQFVAWTTSAGPGCAAWPRYTAKTHGVPWGRPPPLPKRPSPRSSAA